MKKSFLYIKCQQFVIFIVKVYKKLISPFLPSACRFQPTCSEYMIQAIQVHGLCKGIYLGIKRILRCNPWGGSGYDPVPTPKDKRTTNKNTD